MRLIGLAITLAFSLTLTPLTGEGQQAGKPYRIGTLSGGSPDQNSPHIEAFPEGLRDMGCVLIAKLPRPEVRPCLIALIGFIGLLYAALRRRPRATLDAARRPVARASS